MYSLNNGEDDNRVAIVGIGCKFPGNANSPNQFYENIRDKKESIVDISSRFSSNYYKSGLYSNNVAGLIPLDDWQSFDSIFFGISPSEALTIDPSQRTLLKCTWEAMEDALIDPFSLRGSDSTVFVGMSTPEYQYSTVSSYDPIKNLFGATPHSLANRISFCFDLRGTSLSIDTGCSSSLNAAVLGYDSIIKGGSEVSIVGGYNFLMDPFFTKGLSHLEMLSKAGKSCPFDASADGYVRGEGCGIVIFKRLSAAIRDSNRIYCVVEGANSNVDGYFNKNTFYAPSIPSQVENILKTFKSTNGRIDPKDVSFFECHGTSTLVGDPIETEALSRVFKDNHSSDHPLLIGSIKSNIGHLEGGSGIASLIKCCIMFKFRQFLPNINFQVENPKIKFSEWNLKVNTQVLEFSRDNTIIMMNNFGVTGSNACLLLSEFNNSNSNHNSLNNINQSNNNNSNNKYQKEYLIPFSANSKKSLRNYQIEIINTINNLKDKSSFINFVKNQIYNKSKRLIQRSVCKAKSWDDIAVIENYIDTNHSKVSNITVNKKQKPNVIFVFPGQGAQYVGMGSSLYKTNKIFKYWIDLLDAKFERFYGYSVWERINSINITSDTINEPIIAQPSLCMIEVALYHLYRYWNVNPSLIVGHSLGEATAQYCSGSIDLDTLASVIYSRSKAQQKTIGSGRMLSINMTVEQYVSQYSSKYPSLEICCYNSPESIVVGGNESILSKLESELKPNNIFTALLSVKSSFHTSSQDIVRDEVVNLTFNANLESKTPVFSTVYSTLFDNVNGPTYTPQYCFDNIRMPVQFSTTIDNIYKYIEENQLSSDTIFLEISPHPTLVYYLKQMVPKESNYFSPDSITILSSLNKKTPNDQSEFNNTISKLYCFGYNGLDFSKQFDQETDLDSIIDLPTYKWDEDKLLLEDKQHHYQRTVGPPVDLLGNENLLSPIKSFITYIDVKNPIFKYLKGHSVNGGFNFPGFGYVDNIINYAYDSDLIIGGIEFKDPLIFKSGENSMLHTNIIEIAKNHLKVHFHYYNSKSERWIETANVNVYLVEHDYDGDSQLEPMNIQEIMDQCNHSKVETQELYNFIKSKTGVRYSENFVGVKECYFGSNKCLSVIPINLPNSELDINHSIINVTTLDCCLHGIFGFIKDPCQLFLDKLENFKYYSKNVPSIDEYDYIYAYGELKKVYGNSYYASFKVLLPDGTVVVSADNIVLTSSIEIRDSLTLQYEPSFYYENYLEPVVSTISNPSEFSHLFKFNNSLVCQDLQYYNKLVINLLYSNIKSKINISKDQIESLSLPNLAQLYLQDKKHSRLFNYLFKSLKSNINLLENQDHQSYQVRDKNLNDIIEKSLKIITNNLFPNLNHDLMIDYPESLYYDGWLNYFYSNNGITQYLNSLVCEIISKSILKQINAHQVIRILEINGGLGSLSVQVIDVINQLFESNPDYEIDVEYTYSHDTASHVNQVKEKLKHFRGSVVYKVIDIEDSLIENQNLKPNYFDFIIISNTLHLVKQVRPAINQFYQVLKPNGQLLVLEFPQDSLVMNCCFGFFDQHWTFSDSTLRSDCCLLNQSQWSEVLESNNFSDTNFTIQEDTLFYLIQSRKSLNLHNTSISQSISLNNQQQKHIILYTFEKDNRSTITNNFINQLNNKYSTFNSSSSSSIDEINQLNKLLPTITNSSIIYFIKTIEKLNISNFKETTLEYIQLCQYLISNNLESKVILVTFESFGDSANYLNSSVNGAFRYFCEDQEQLELYSFDLDVASINGGDNCSINCINQIECLVNQFYQTEFIIRDGVAYVEKMKRIKNSLKKYVKEDQYDMANCNQDLYISNYNFKLQPVLELKQQNELEPNQVEIQVKSFGIDYKDHLLYKKKKVLNNKFITFGSDFAGIVKRVGNQAANHYKIGDKVYGLQINSSQSSIIVEYDQISLIPSQLTFNQASSIPSVYISSYYCLFYLANLQVYNDDEEITDSILIHSATNEYGLGMLNLLKWKGIKTSKLYVTVNSNDKKEYLENEYGSLISGIFSNSNSNFEKEIKSLNNGEGIDIIINLDSSEDISTNEFMDSNCKLLNSGGKIIDCMNLNQVDDKEYISLNLNGNGSYVKLNSISTKVSNRIFRIISRAINTNQLNLVPIIQFDNSEFKNAILETYRKRKIGKVVVDFSSDTLKALLAEKFNNHKIVESNYKINSIGKTVLVSGQTGIALELIKWIIKFSSEIQNIIIISKSSMKWELKNLIKRTNDSNSRVKFYFISTDIGDKLELYKSIKQLYNDNPTLTLVESIFHYAFIQVVCKPLDISMNDLNNSHNAKTLGAINLHELSIDLNWPIRSFVLASSTASKFGSYNQCTYVSALCALDSISRYRRSIGLPSISINMGSILSVGISAVSDTIYSMLESQGIYHISVNQLLGSMDLILNNQFSNFTIHNIQFNNVQIKKYTYPIIDYYLNQHQNISASTNNINNEKDKIINKIGELLSIDPSKLNESNSLYEYGIDSLNSTTLRNWFSKEYYLNIVTTDQIQNLTIINLINLIKKYLNKK